ncbi:MAG: hypothetical protein JO142_11630 [Burkholderiales bacterium]|nr:hypothetical protein [Burkholderiales bacterium]
MLYQALLRMLRRHVLLLAILPLVMTFTAVYLDQHAFALTTLLLNLAMTFAAACLVLLPVEYHRLKTNHHSIASRAS